MRNTSEFNTTLLKRLLITLHGFIAISAAAGGYYIVSTGGKGMPISWLQDSPFHNYLIPGIILLFIVGGTNLAAVFMLFRKHQYALETSAVGAFGLLIWITTELYIIKQSHWLQMFYYTLATTILISVMLLLKYKKGAA